MAVPKPTSKPEWAKSDLTDGTTNAPNKEEPTNAFKASGLNRQEPLPRAYLNYQFDNINDWIDWIEDQINTLSLDNTAVTLNSVYPVGSYYFNDSDSTDPATLLGIGTWARVKGRFLVGLDEADTDFDGAGEEGGSKTHTHTDTFSVDGHSLTVLEMPAHSHSFDLDYQPNNKSSEGRAFTDGNVGGIKGTATLNTASTGNGDAHTHGLSGSIASSSNLPPYRAVYIWRRTA